MSTYLYRTRRTERVGMTALTKAQQAVLDEMRRGGSMPEIAKRLWLSPNTVKTHVMHLFRIYGVHGRDELMAAVGSERG